MSNAIVQGQRPTFLAMMNTDKFQRIINSTIKEPGRARRFVSSIVSSVAVNPSLQECTPQTILSGALLGESLNLSPSPQLGQYYLVPFKQKEKKDRYGNVISPECTNAQFVLGYKGMVQLALRSGYYKKLTVVSIKGGELHNWNPITEDFSITPIEDEEEREKASTVGYLASFEYLNGFTKTIYWSKEKMVAHADRYSAAFSKEATKGLYPKVSFADYEAHNYPQKDEWMYSSFWYKDFDGMAHKTMLRQLISKWGVMSIDLQTAFDGDGAVVTDSGEFLHVEDAALPAPTEQEYDAVPYEEPEPAQERAKQAEGKMSLSDV